MIIDELKEIVQTTMPDRKIDYDHITMQSSLQKDLGFDSIAYIMLAIGIEAKYGVELSQLDTVKFETVGDVVSDINSGIDELDNSAFEDATLSDETLLQPPQETE